MQLFFGVLAPLPFTFPAMGNAFLAVATASAIFGLVFFGLRDTWPLKKLWSGLGRGGRGGSSPGIQSELRGELYPNG